MEETQLITVYISIGNSDDYLSQERWAEFVGVLHTLTDPYADDAWVMARHGEWFSDPWSPWQNACWCVELDEDAAPALKAELGRVARRYQQESIAWAEASTTFLTGVRERS